MNNIQRAGMWIKVKRVVLLPWFIVKWEIARNWVFWKLIRTMFYTKEIEKSLQENKQIMHDHYYARRMDDYKATKGFCEGIEYCLERKWLK